VVLLAKPSPEINVLPVVPPTKKVAAVALLFATVPDPDSPATDWAFRSE